MPTLLRLLTVAGVAAALVYGAMLTVVALVKPEPHEIVTAIALPQSAEMHSGRSAAETLNVQAAALVHHATRKGREARTRQD